MMLSFWLQVSAILEVDGGTNETNLRTDDDPSRRHVGKTDHAADSGRSAARATTDGDAPPSTAIEAVEFTGRKGSKRR